MEPKIELSNQGEKGSPISKTTESMVTVRLSDPDISSLPSPTPTLKLVDEKLEEYPLNDGPIFTPEQTESPNAEDMTASKYSSMASDEEPENAVDWAGQ